MMVHFNKNYPFPNQTWKQAVFPIFIQKYRNILGAKVKFLPSILNRFEGRAAKQKSGNHYQIFTYLNIWKKEPDQFFA